MQLDNLTMQVILTEKEYNDLKEGATHLSSNCQSIKVVDVASGGRIRKNISMVYNSGTTVYIDKEMLAMIKKIDL